MRHGRHNVAGTLLRREMHGSRPPSFGSDNYWMDYRVTHRSTGTSGVLAFNWKAEHGVLLAVGSRDAYALNIVSLERAPAKSAVWSAWAPWKRDAEAAALRGACEPHVLAVEANAHSNWINDVAFSPDDLDLLSASEDGTVVLYDVQRGRKRTVHELPGAQAARSVCTAALDRDSVFVAANNSVYAWDRRTKGAGQAFGGHAARVSDVQCTQDGRLLWSTSLDGTLRCWDRRKGVCLTSLGGRSTPLASVCLDRTESRLLVSSERGPVFLFDLVDCPALQGPALAAVPAVKTFTGHSNRHYLKRARFSPCGDYVMCGSDDKRAYVWNVSTGRSHAFELPDVRLTSLVDATFSHGPQQPLVGVASEEGLFVWSPAPRPPPAAAAADGAAVAPAGAGAHEIKFAVEGAPLEDDFVEVDDNADEEEEEEELEEELGDLVREPGVCAYDKGYATTHVFVCRTCSLSTEPHTSAGMCYECRIDCHADHETVSIGKKKNFRCDCGTDKYPGVPCLLRAGKQPNDRNAYTHNFDLLYCFCNQPDNGELMILCVECLEWFHHSCLEIPNQEAITEGLDFICASCVTARFPFLTQYRTASLAARTARPADDGALGFAATGGRFLPPQWRESRLLRPEHARLAAAEAEGARNAPAPNAPATQAPVSAVAPPPPAAAALFEPRTKEELDAEARRLIQMGDREGARNLVMRAMLSNTLNLLSSSRRRTVTVQDVARAAQDMQAAPASTAISTTANLTDVEVADGAAAPASAPAPPSTPIPAPTPAPVPAPASSAPPPHGEKHARTEEAKPTAPLATPAAERPAKLARHADDTQVPPPPAPAPVAAPVPPTPPPAAATPPQTAALRTSNPPAEARPAPATPLRSSASTAPAAAPATPLRSSASATTATPATPLRSSAPTPAPLPVAPPAPAPVASAEPSGEAAVEVEEMDAAPEEALEAEAEAEAEAMESGPEPVAQPPPPVAKPATVEPEVAMAEAPAEAEAEGAQEPEEAMPDAAPAAAPVASAPGAASTGSLDAIVGANEALADDLERRLAEIVDSGV